MMPGLINNPLSLSAAPQAGAAGGHRKLGADEAALPLPALQPNVGVGGARGLSKIVAQAIAGVRSRPNSVHTEVLSKPRMAENFELVTERGVPDYGSSGSDHDPSSVSLFAMVHEFIENEGAGEEADCLSDGCHGFLNISNNSVNVNGAVDMAQTIQSLALCVDSTEDALLRDTQLIVNSITDEVRQLCDNGKPATITHSCLKRTVMVRLQEMGYIAAICKTKWDHLCGIPAGDYDYIDVLLTSDSATLSKRPERLLVDIEFQAQFDIARPTNEFMSVWQFLPPIFVGRAERLKQIVRLMSEATKYSMRAKGLHLPPWRKPAYMKAKWFSSYKRTSNITSSRPCRDGGHYANGLGLATRGGGLNAKYTTSFEMLYHDAGAKFLTSDGTDVALFRKGRDENAMALSRRVRDEITVVVTDWQPPVVAPSVTIARRQGAIAGLASVLSNGPASVSCHEALVQAA